MKQKAYAVAVCCSAWDIIPDAEHIERIASVAERQGYDETFDDFAAAQLAKKDGVKLIDDIDGIYKDFYVDTDKNRKVINDYMTTHPEQIGYELMGIERNTRSVRTVRVRKSITWKLPRWFPREAPV